MIVLNNGEWHTIGAPFTPNTHAIAGALCHLNRFTGHVGQYSVAQHSCHVSDNMPDELKLDGLLHDATEAYLGDVSAPLKAHLPEYARLEAFYHEQIDKHYGVATRHEMVKSVDLRMLVTEARDLGLDVDAFPVFVAPFDFTVERWSADRAYQEFMSRFIALGGRV